MTEDARWSEQDSALYREIAAVAVPSRDEQCAAMVSLLPFARPDTFHTIEMGCGDGRLAETVLRSFPNASVLALDRCPSMRDAATKRLAPFGRRAQVESFDLRSDAWWPFLAVADCAISSLAVHHLDGSGKQRLFQAVHDRLPSRGALLIADLVEPLAAAGRSLFGDMWDRAARAQSVAQTGSLAAADRFAQARWNHFRFPDPADSPSPLLHQLLWLKHAGFSGVDCFWLTAGHAIYGGYKELASRTAAGVSFEEALEAARLALGTDSRA